MLLKQYSPGAMVLSKQMHLQQPTEVQERLPGSRRWRIGRSINLVWQQFSDRSLGLVWPGLATHLLMLVMRHRTEFHFQRVYFVFFIQQRCCSDRGFIIISPLPRSHPTDEVRLAAGGQSARRSWLIGRLPAQQWYVGWSAATATRDDMMKLESCPSLLQPPCHFQIAPLYYTCVSS